jgi:Flp pilus assembly pilin Flp
VVGCRIRLGTLVEYGLVVALVSVVTVRALAALGTDLQNVYDHVNDVLEKLPSSAPGCASRLKLFVKKRRFKPLLERQQTSSTRVCRARDVVFWRKCDTLPLNLMVLRPLLR